ncbi:MAG: translocated intimin receptor Tir [Acidobacteriales bacterium]|nr:translocated intimin receptor Tir [Terriglobales bacterium]
MNERHATSASLVRAVLTDIQFWIPALVLAGGILLLAIIN